MDARTLSAATGVDVGTLNAWISRELVPGITPSAQGKRRDFDVDAATHVAIMAELSSFGFGAPLAMMTAQHACRALKGDYFSHLDAKALSAIAGVDRGTGSHPIFLVTRYIEKRLGGEVHHKPFKSEKALAQFLAATPPSERPGVYLTIDTGRIFAKVQKVEEEWQRRRNKTPGEE